VIDAKFGRDYYDLISATTIGRGLDLKLLDIKTDPLTKFNR
jgi:hypothetical protein